MTKEASTSPIPDRSYLNFEGRVRETFAFLGNIGFLEIESLPTLVRFRKGEVEVDVYHGRQSYEIGAGITHSGVRYVISEIILAIDPEVAARYRRYAATTPQGVATGLEELSELMKRYGARALSGEARFFLELEKQRKSRKEEYALNVLAEQVRPKADEAFRQGDYATAADLYACIRGRLSPAELKKLTLAEKRRNR